MNSGTISGAVLDGGGGTSSNISYMQIVERLPFKPQGMTALRFNKILRLAKRGEICAVFNDHLWEDVPRPNITYTIHNSLSSYHSPNPKRRCKLCAKEQEYRPADWVDTDSAEV